MNSFATPFLTEQHQADLRADAQAHRLARMSRDADEGSHEPVTWSVSQGHRRLVTALAGLVLTLGAIAGVGLL